MVLSASLRLRPPREVERYHLYQTQSAEEKADTGQLERNGDVITSLGV
jgi:hypothetical protein